ncbi:hypothetical protein DFP72DRAFT_1169019 [Ephemerocybe angulata]|uniref:Uncharacterized protein n=1 Tax=Ephemerocybe angulata TaxID=980116 RepID=A0A8H6I0E5_9AGAR|nr:hypothetical protein DFP72DRAFT_1169019 [Tulosesus angulatus]
MATRGTKAQDGLTKDQRYHKAHYEKRKQENRERMRATRALARAQAQVQVDQPTQPAALGATSEVHAISAHADPFGPVESMPAPPVIFADNTFSRNLKMVEAGFMPRWDNENWLQQLQRLSQISDGTILPNAASSLDIPEWDRFREIHPLVIRWTTPWGGVNAWAESFETIFYTMCAKGKTETSNWLRAIWGHAETGKRLLDLLRTTNLPLPDNPVNTQLLWTKKMEATEILVKGITIIETRYNVMGRGVFGVEGEPVDSSGEEDMDNFMEEEEEDDDLGPALGED